MVGKNVDFKNTTKLSEWIFNIIKIRIVLAIIIQITPASPGEELLTMGDWVVMTAGGAVILLNIVGGILFLRWIYLSYINSILTGAKNMNFSPGWSVGWFFIPLMNLFMPFRVMKEIWKTSRNSEDWTSLETPKIIIWWWFLYLFSNFVSQVAFRANLSLFSISLENYLVIINLSEAVFGIAYWVIQMKLIKEITEMQNQTI